MGSERSVVIALECDASLQNRVKYVFDTLFMAAGIRVEYQSSLLLDRPGIVYTAEVRSREYPLGTCVIPHLPAAWSAIVAGKGPLSLETRNGVPVLWAPAEDALPRPRCVDFDLPANVFYFLASCSERATRKREETRSLYAASEFNSLGIPQSIVDDLLDLLIDRTFPAFGVRSAKDHESTWPGGKCYAVVLSHDVDFLPVRPWDIPWQGIKTLGRHLIRERSPSEAARAMAGLIRAIFEWRDPYGCIPEIIEGERHCGVKSSFQVAVARRHPADVNYSVAEKGVQKYLGVIREAGFDLCLHGSYTSTRSVEAYCDEVAACVQHLGRPKGSRQHFLSFDYDVLFAAQEMAEIEYDMSIGYPDRTGSRVGFSHPFFPYCLDEDRPYNVVEIPIVLMDSTMRGYMGMRSEQAWEEIERQLDHIRKARGCGSVVWHPIVFGDARDPGYGKLYWKLVDRLLHTDGLATDGATVNQYWRGRAAAYESFAGLGAGPRAEVSDDRLRLR